MVPTYTVDYKDVELLKLCWSQLGLPLRKKKLNYEVFPTYHGQVAFYPILTFNGNIYNLCVMN